jgi:hypothetical protein
MRGRGFQIFHVAPREDQMRSVVRDLLGEGPSDG